MEKTDCSESIICEKIKGIFNRDLRYEDWVKYFCEVLQKFKFEGCKFKDKYNTKDLLEQHYSVADILKLNNDYYKNKVEDILKVVSDELNLTYKNRIMLFYKEFDEYYNFILEQYGKNCFILNDTTDNKLSFYNTPSIHSIVKGALYDIFVNIDKYQYSKKEFFKPEIKFNEPQDSLRYHMYLSVKKSFEMEPFNYLLFIFTHIYSLWILKF